jgi:hypothetical protein
MDELEKEKKEQEVEALKEKQRQTVIKASEELEEKERIAREERIEKYNKLKERLNEVIQNYKMQEESSSDIITSYSKEELNNHKNELEKQLREKFIQNEKDRLFYKNRDEEDQRKEKLMHDIYEQNKANNLSGVIYSY